MAVLAAPRHRLETPEAVSAALRVGVDDLAATVAFDRRILPFWNLLTAIRACVQDGGLVVLLRRFTILTRISRLLLRLPFDSIDPTLMLVEVLLLLDRVHQILIRAETRPSHRFFNIVPTFFYINNYEI